MTLTLIKNAVSESKIRYLLSDHALDNPVKILYRNQFNTAAWNWRPSYHTIYVGMDILDEKKNSLIKPGLTDDEKKEYLDLYFNHELSHAFETVRDLPRFSKLLNDLKISFQLFNLFEDARIERCHVTKRGRQKFFKGFTWLKFENMPLTLKASADTMFFSFIQADGQYQTVKDFALALDSNTESMFHQKLEKVWEYYLKACKVEASEKLIPVLMAWLTEFPNEVSDSDSRRFGGNKSSEGEGSPSSPSGGKPSGKNGQPGDGQSELEQMASIMSNPKTLEHFDAQCQGESESDEDEKPSNATVQQQLNVLPNKSTEMKGSAEVLTDGQHSINMEEVYQVVELLKRVLTPKQKTLQDRTPSKKVAIKPLMQGQILFKHTVMRSRKAKKKVFLVVDCSGSMGGSHIRDARALVAALSILAAHNLVEGHVYLSIVVGRHAKYQGFKLPMAESDICRIEAYGGGEGLENTIANNIALAKDADLAMVFTDGQISDKAINKHALHAKGVYTWGLYTGTVDAYKASLLRYFDRAIVKDSLSELIQTLLFEM